MVSAYSTAGTSVTGMEYNYIPYTYTYLGFWYRYYNYIYLVPVGWVPVELRVLYHCVLYPVARARLDGTCIR